MHGVKASCSNWFDFGSKRNISQDATRGEIESNIGLVVFKITLVELNLAPGQNIHSIPDALVCMLGELGGIQLSVENQPAQRTWGIALVDDVLAE